MLEWMDHLVWSLHATADAGTIQAAAAGSSDGDVNTLAFLFLLAGPAFYALMFLRYRNVGQRHRHAAETKADMADVQATDSFQQSLTGLRNSRMHGANNHSVRGSLRRFL